MAATAALLLTSSTLDFLPGEERSPMVLNRPGLFFCRAPLRTEREQRAASGFGSPPVLTSGQIIKNNIRIPGDLTDFITSTCHLHPTVSTEQLPSAAFAALGFTSVRLLP